MRIFAVFAGLGLVIGGGSLLSLWLTFVVGNLPFAVVALVTTGVLAIGWIVRISRAEQV